MYGCSGWLRPRSGLRAVWARPSLESRNSQTALPRQTCNWACTSAHARQRNHEVRLAEGNRMQLGCSRPCAPPSGWPGRVVRTGCRLSEDVALRARSQRFRLGKRVHSLRRRWDPSARQQRAPSAKSAPARALRGAACGLAALHSASAPLHLLSAACGPMDAPPSALAAAPDAARPEELRAASKRTRGASPAPAASPGRRGERSTQMLTGVAGAKRARLADATPQSQGQEDGPKGPSSRVVSDAGRSPHDSRDGPAWDQGEVRQRGLAFARAVHTSQARVGRGTVWLCGSTPFGPGARAWGC